MSFVRMNRKTLTGRATINYGRQQRPYAFSIWSPSYSLLFVSYEFTDDWWLKIWSYERRKIRKFIDNNKKNGKNAFLLLLPESPNKFKKKCSNSLQLEWADDSKNSKMISIDV